jgi:Zn-dependent M28 family amino/carboxypeptidase
MCKTTTHHNSKLDRNITNAKTTSVEIESFNKKLDDKIVSLINQVSLENIKSKLMKLSSYHTRHTKSKYINEVAEWLKDEFKNIGYEDVSFHEYKERIDENEYNLKNIICKKNGKNHKCIIICAHYDSRMELWFDSYSRAPGANDNASGVSSILEIARVLYNKKLNYDLQFVLFSGEEQNLLGSEQYAKFIRNENLNLHRLINLDMIGYPKLNQGKIIIEKDYHKLERHNRVVVNDKDSIECGNIMVEMCAYTDLYPDHGPIFSSDYEPFEKRGYVVVGAYDGSAETEENPHYHSISDTPEKIDWNYLTSVTKIVLATIITLDKKIKTNIN